MIGIGGNRIAGGRMSGFGQTLQVKGGMALVGDVRMPKWASPYSDYATLVLRNTFPTYWGEIAAYGIAHPEIVPFVNEDPIGYFNPRILIIEASGLTTKVVFENVKAIKIEVYGGTSAGVSYMDVTVDGSLVYHRTQADTGFNAVNVANLITTRRVSAGADWWRVDAVAYCCYNNVVYTSGQQIYHIERTNGRTTYELIGIPPITP